MTSAEAESPRIVTVDRPALRRRLPAARIVVGVDGSPGSRAALRWASAEAARRQAGLRIVSAWQYAGPGTAGHGVAFSPSSAAAARVQDALDLVVGLDGHPVSISCVAPRGESGEALVEQASGAQMLILGAAPEAGPGRTALYCLRFACCPVVFVCA